MLPDVESPAYAEALRRSAPDLVVSWFWTRRLPAAVREAAPLGAFGVHPSLLPRHRGPDPYYWTLASGDMEAGVTAHVLDDAYDTGAILGQRTLPVVPTWNAWHLARALDRPSLGLLREVTASFARGTPPTPRAQDEARATPAPAPDDELLEIDWTQPVDRVVHHVRAAAPVPGAYTFLGDVAVVLTRVEVTSDFPKALAPGEAAVVDGWAVVRAAGGAVRLLEGRVEDAEGRETRLGKPDLARVVRGLLASSR